MYVWNEQRLGLNQLMNGGRTKTNKKGTEMYESEQVFCSLTYPE